jgi:hypothetical protein
MRDVEPPYVSNGSKRESAVFGPVSASSGCGHAAARGYVREVRFWR